jgi:hypothetical protein
LLVPFIQQQVRERFAQRILVDVGGEAPEVLRQVLLMATWIACERTVCGRAGHTDIMHVTDWFTTLLHAARAHLPADRVIDGINQLPWLSGQQESSQREGYLYWMGPELYGVKWRNFKLALAVQKYATDPVGKLPSPWIINLIADPDVRSQRTFLSVIESCSTGSLCH